MIQIKTNKLIRKKGIQIPDRINNYSMKLVKASNIEVNNEQTI